MTDKPLYWIKQVEGALNEAKQIPMLGSPPAFPFDACAKKIAESLQLPEMNISIHRSQFLPAKDISSGLGNTYVTLPVELSPLIEKAYWIMAGQDIAKLSAFLLPQGTKGFTSPKLQEGFYTFLALKAAQAIDETSEYPVKIGSPSHMPHEEAYCIDVQIQHARLTLWGRLACPISFLNALKAHYQTQRPSLLTSAFAKQLDVTVKFEVAKTTLALSQWKKIAVGDFIRLDHCSYDLDSKRGSVTMLLHETPLLRARLKDNHLKITDYAFYHEDAMSYDDDDDDEYEDDEDEDLEDDDEDDIEDEDDDDDSDDEDDDEDTDEDDDEDEDVEELEEDEDEDEDVEEEASDEEDHLWSTETEEPASASHSMISRSEIPLTLTVEVGRLHINLEQLLQLKPGNLLELAVHPEQGVDVTIGGKKVAKAELVKMGDLLGIKILAMGE